MPEFEIYSFLTGLGACAVASWLLSGTYLICQRALYYQDLRKSCKELFEKSQHTKPICSYDGTLPGLERKSDNVNN